MKRRTVVLLFALGSCVGIPFAGLYILHSPSVDKFFHAFVIGAACCVSFPAVVIFLRITLNMWDMAQEQRAAMLELRDSIRPFAEGGKKAVDAVNEIVEDLKTRKAVKILEFMEKVEQDGTIPKLVGSVEKIAAKVGEYIRHATRKGEVEVPILDPEGRGDDGGVGPASGRS